jgi:AraC family transcriptional regulator
MKLMSDSAREEYAAAFEPSSYPMHGSIAPSVIERAAAHAVDQTVQVYPSEAVCRRTGSWHGMAVEIIQANRRGRIDYHYSGPLPMLVVHDRGVRQDGCTVIEGLPKSTLQDLSRKLVFVPADHEYHDWHEPRTLSRMVFFHLNPDLLTMGPELGHSRPSLAPHLFFEDRALMETALKLGALIEKGGADHGPYLQALGVVLAHELVRIDTARRNAEAPINGGLAAWQRRKAVAYIEEHLAEPISLAALARLVGLSACYFCRAFRQSFAMPPQRYQLKRRIECAKTLLAKRAASVTDVGLAVGYNDTSSFCTAFRRATGVTPGAYRRNFS